LYNFGLLPIAYGVIPSFSDFIDYILNDLDEIISFIPNTNYTASKTNFVIQEMTFSIDLWFIYTTQTKIIVGSDLSIANTVLAFRDKKTEIAVLDSICFDNISQDIIIYDPNPKIWKDCNGLAANFSLSFYNYNSKQNSLEPLIFSSVQIEVSTKKKREREIRRKKTRIIREPVTNSLAVAKILHDTENARWHHDDVRYGAD
jgi:hypothetical protein